MSVQPFELIPNQPYVIKYKEELEIVLFESVVYGIGVLYLNFTHCSTGEKIKLHLDCDLDIHKAAFAL